MPRKESPKTTEQKLTLWNEIENLQREKAERLAIDFIDTLDLSKSKDLKLAAMLLRRSEEELREWIKGGKEALHKAAKRLSTISKEELAEGLRKLREENSLRKEIADTLIEIRERGDTLRDMNLGLATTKELLNAVRKYGSIEDSLEAFRGAISTIGYTGLDPILIPVIKVYGNGRDKALLILMGIFEPIEASDFRLSTKEGKEISKSVSGGSDKDIEDYGETLIVYDTIKSTQWMIRHVTNFYLESKWEFAQAVTEYEQMIEEADIFNRVSAIVPPDRQQELLSILEETYNNREEKLRDMGRLSLSSDGRFKERELSKIKKRLISRAEDYNFTLSCVKGCYTALEKWIRERGAEDLTPQIIKEFLYDEKMTLLDVSFPDMYYNRNLNSLTGEKGLALLMDYEDISPDSDAYGAMLKFLGQEYGRRKK